MFKKMFCLVSLVLVLGVQTAMAEEWWVEAEDYETKPDNMIVTDKPPDDWQVPKNPPPSNGLFLLTPEGSGSNFSAPDPGPYATYPFTVKGGVYKVFVRYWVPYGAPGREKPGDSDSCWWRIQTATLNLPAFNEDGWIRAMNISPNWDLRSENRDQFFWWPIKPNERGGDYEFTLEPGDHVLEFAPREDGLGIDCILITDDLNTNLATLPDELPKKAKGVSSNPNPGDGAINVPRDVGLSWTPGAFAKTHDVYFGTSFVNVNDAGRTNPLGVLASQGQSESTYDPLLDLGQTYYWRIDEVNAPPDSTVFKGEVWSFTVEPTGYPIEDVNATASSANMPTEGPENTVNTSGLDDDDLHSSESAHMWLSSVLDPNTPWIQYDFDKVLKLHQMQVWNYNSTVESLIGFGVREATIEYSVDGVTWAALGTTHEFARAPGLPGLAADTTIDFGGVSAKHVKITANSNWGGIVAQVGLSEVRLLSVPVRAREANPASGATDVDADATLSFRAGREAAGHNVYLSTDEQAVIDGNVPVITVTEPGYASSLDLASTYYWRIDEVNEAETPATWQGDIWSFSTQEYIVVEDFESYNDITAEEEGSNLIYGTWADGVENPANGGSTVGYNVPFEPTMETSIVYDGRQSVPLFYDNTAAAHSEITANVADLQGGSDWAKHGIKALTLRFHGDPNNSITDQLYVKVNGSKVLYDGDVDALTRTGWQMWYVDLASIGAGLSNVTTLSIGFERVGAVGGQGVVYLDGIRLYSHDRQTITPTDPGTTGLQAHYEFEGTTDDSSGNARHGAGVGTTFVPGKVGQAVSLDGLDYVEITGYKGILGPNAVTVTAWVNTTATETGTIVGWGPVVDGQRFGFRMNAGRLRLEVGGGNI
ncbi:MAG: discoidin domain-containing protein, partial [Planctomycetota bacterium]